MDTSSAVPPCAVGLVSGSMIFSCSMMEPGQPWVTIIGSPFFVPGAHVDEMNVEAIDVVMNCGSALSFASTLRQSYSDAQ